MENLELLGIYGDEMENETFNIELGRYYPYITDADDNDMVMTFTNNLNHTFSLIMTKHQLDYMIKSYQEKYGKL